MNSNVQLALAREAKRLRKPVEALSNNEVTKIAASQMSPKKLAISAFEAVSSLVGTQTGIRSVPLPIYEARKRICDECPYAGHSNTGALYCTVCGCAGVWMESALNDKHQSCRLEEPQRRWSKWKSNTETGLNARHTP